MHKYWIKILVTLYSDAGLSPNRRQAIIRTKGGWLLTGPHCERALWISIDINCDMSSKDIYHNRPHHGVSSIQGWWLQHYICFPKWGSGFYSIISVMHKMPHNVLCLTLLWENVILFWKLEYLRTENVAPTSNNKIYCTGILKAWDTS